MNINQLFDEFVGGGTTSTATQANQPPRQVVSGGVAGLMGKLTDGPAGGFAGGLAAGGLLGTLMGNKKMRKKATKVAGGAVGYGGSAVLGALALKAYQNWQSGKSVQTTSRHDSPAPQLPSPEAFDPALNSDATGQPMQLALVKAMIAAANADGHIDHDEQAAVFGAVDNLSLDADSKAVIFDVLRNPPTVAQIAGYATGTEQASEIYIASRLAIDPDQPSERRYLDDLAKAMGLPGDLVHEIEMRVEPVPVSPPAPKAGRHVGQFGRAQTVMTSQHQPTPEVRHSGWM